MILIRDIKITLNQHEDDLKNIIENKLGVSIIDFKIIKKSLDARKKPIYVYSVIVDVDDENKYINNKDIFSYKIENFSSDYIKRNKTCIIVGYGPSGIFSAYRLTLAGYRVLVFEKGKRISKRVKDVELLFNEGVFNEQSNVQFGEGGAGTFSDAKLTTRIKDKYIDYILDVFVDNGANPSIKYENHPHIGTDKIRNIICNITDFLISNGCEFHFEEEINDVIIENNVIKGVITNKESYFGDYFLFGIGHSSYKTINMLVKNGVFVEKKDMAIGFRVEHPQSLINQNQTESIIKEPNEYFLRYKGKKGVYSFCMCPGGIVIPAMSDSNTIVTNGMSYSNRDSNFANSAILIQLPKEQFDDGFLFLHSKEKLAYEYSSSYKALAQNIKDYLNNEKYELIFNSTYPLGTVLYDFNNFFSDEDNRIIKDALLYFDSKINGFIDNGIMVGPETRSSSPIRITRNINYESISTKNLYPMGEGSGYGGGIMSCALDGIRIANKIILNYE